MVDCPLSYACKIIDCRIIRSNAPACDTKLLLLFQEMLNKH